MAGNDNELDKKLENVRIPYHIIDYSDNRFSDEERRYLKNQLRSMFAFVGCVVPKSVTADSVEMPLREIVWRLLTKENLTGQDIALANELVPILEMKMNDNERMIGEYNLTDSQAEKLYFEACGLLKAIVTLRGLDRNRGVRLEDAVNEEKVKDAKRLLELLKGI